MYKYCMLKLHTSSNRKQGIMHKLAIVLVALATVFLQSEAKTFTRCELVRELRKQRFPESQMRNWVCLIESESGRSTNKVNVNSNGSRDYGLFQINDQYWCSNTNKPGKDCNITCSQLLADNISVASKCAKKIYNRQKFEAWYGWINKCKGKLLPDIRMC